MMSKALGLTPPPSPAPRGARSRATCPHAHQAPDLPDLLRQPAAAGVDCRSLPVPTVAPTLKYTVLLGIITVPVLPMRGHTRSYSLRISCRTSNRWIWVCGLALAMGRGGKGA